MNLKPNFTSAGTWVPVTNSQFLSSSYNGQLANTFHSIIQLGPSGQYGLVVSGWGYSGWPPSLSSAAPVSIAILGPNGAGGVTVDTSDYITDPVTNGAGSVIVADFNGDGRPDIFLAAHNESPFISLNSTAYLSNSNGTFSKVVLSDHVMAHDAILEYVNGIPTVFTATFSPGDTSPFFTYSNGGFIENLPAGVSSLWGMSTTVVSSNSGPSLELIRGDVFTGYDPATGLSTAQDIYVYGFSGTDITSRNPLQIIVPYLSTLPQYANFPSQIGGPGLTHVSRLWSDDLNHDGKQDMLAGESMWSQAAPNFPSALQVLINNGDGTFRDATATLNPDMGFNTNEMDYNPVFVDLDHSGINTYLFSGSTSWGDPSRQSDYILLNDGTGRLYVALHDQFFDLAKQVYSYLALTWTNTSTPPRFIGIPQPDGSLNFVAEVAKSVFNASANIYVAAYSYVNVALDYNPTTDFTTSVDIEDRNQSELIRTWAGNDVFHDKNANSVPAHIDGGLGFNTSIYSDVLKNYTVNQVAPNVYEVRHLVSSGAPSVDDTLVNIQKLQFSDSSINTTMKAEAAKLSPGQVNSLVELYVAYFARTPDAVGLSYWIDKAAAGESLTDIAKEFYNAGVQYSSLTGYGATMSNTDFIKLVYANVLGRTGASAPPASDVAYWNNQIQSGATTKEGLIQTMLTAAHGFANDPTWGWVPQLLNNRVAVGYQAAVTDGLDYNSSTDAITKGMAIVHAVTPTDTSAAVSLIGVAGHLSL